MNRRRKGDAYNPKSNWQEETSVEGLTLWDLNRPVLTVVTKENDPVIEINTTKLSEFTCPICLGLLRDTWTVMECMHRFCGVCIQRCLRGGKQECPSCRQHVPSKRSLRRDHMYDSLIQQIYSDVDSYERKADKRMKKLNRIRTQKISNDLHQQIKQQEENRKRLRYQKPPPPPRRAQQSSPSQEEEEEEEQGSQKRKKKNAKAGKSGKSGNEKGKKRQRQKYSAEEQQRRQRKRQHSKPQDSNARFQLKVDPKENMLTELEHPWLCTSPQIQVRHLKKYLSRKINIDAQRIEITFFIGGTTQIMLDANTRFIEIEALQQPKEEHVSLYFRIAR